MAELPIFSGAVTTGGKLVLDDRAGFLGHVRAHAGQRVDVILRPHVRPHSDKQRRYYHGVVIKQIAEATGDSRESTHEEMKRKFLTVYDPEPRVRSTTELTTAEFEAYLAEIKVWAAQFLEIVIPDPDQIEFT